METKLFKSGVRIGFIMLLVSLFTNAQTVDWAMRAGSYEVDYGFGVCNDPEGNVYMTGQFEGTTHWDASNITATKGLHDLFIAKYTPAGKLVWVSVAGAPGGDAGKGVALDKHGNVYVVGEMDCFKGGDRYGKMEFGNGITLDSYGINDIFIAKYDPAGKILWARSAGGGRNDKGRAIAVDDAGNAYITGEIESESYFQDDNGGYFKIKAGYFPEDGEDAKKDMFVAKYSTDGNILWAKNFGADTLNDEARGIACDKAGNCYVTGYFKGTAKFGSTTLTSTKTTDVVIWKMNTNGAVQWAKQGGGGFGVGRAIALDEKNNRLYITGEFAGTVKFAAKSISSSGGLDMFTAAYETNGNVIWVKKAGGNRIDVGRGIAIDKFQNVYVTGAFAGSADFSGTNLSTSDTIGDIFTASYTNDGNLRWIQKAGNDTIDEGHAVSVDNKGRIYVTGYFHKTVKFSQVTLSAMAHHEIFLTSYTEPLATKPTTNSGSFVATAVGSCGQMNLSWTPGNGTRRLVISKAGSGVNKAPVNGTEYTANAAFGLGESLGEGNYVVYNGTGSSVTITNLGAGKQYFKIYEYNGTAFSNNYLASGNATVSADGNGINVTVSIAETTICKGGSVALLAGGADTYKWTGAGLNTTNGATVIASPLVNTTYTVTGTKGGCSRSLNSIVNVDQNCDGNQTSIQENQSSDVFLIYPNPNKGNFKVRTSILNKNYKLQIINTLGQIIISDTLRDESASGGQEINLSNCAAGIYLCRIAGLNTQQIQKIIVEK